MTLRRLAGYRLPVPTDTEADAQRLDNLDLATMTRDELQAERWRLQRLLTASPERLSSFLWAVGLPQVNVGPWARTRLRLVETRLGGRRHAA